MSESNNCARAETTAIVPVPSDAVLSDSFADLLVAGVVVELDAAEAEAVGAFEETALSDADAWDANTDLDPDEAHHGA